VDHPSFPPVLDDDFELVPKAKFPKRLPGLPVIGLVVAALCFLIAFCGHFISTIPETVSRLNPSETASESMAQFQDSLPNSPEVNIHKMQLWAHIK